MDKVGQAGEAARRSENTESRAGQSGEGSRSALEQLIHREQQRQAHRPEEASRAPPAEPQS